MIDWEHPFNNDFGIAEEVTLKGENTKRPDLVLYINGIAIGVLELKRSTVSVSEGIRQNLTNQREDFIEGFFTTSSADPVRWKMKVPLLWTVSYRNGGPIKTYSIAHRWHTKIGGINIEPS